MWISEYLGRFFTEGTRLSSVCAVMQGKECLGGKKMPVLNTIYLWGFNLLSSAQAGP